tara:strand:+ start:71 stop:547 length:477 start_codon:yes stop_codon:yes gene_type:complete
VKIYVAFYKGKGNFINAIVRWWTKSEFSHAELILPDKVTWIGISPFIKSQVCRRIVLDVDRKDWKIVSIEVTQEQLNIILDFYNETKGRGYDWVGMLLSQFLPWRIKTKNKWYCSEWISYALRISCALDWKVLRLYERKELSPATLYSILVKNKIISS